MTQEPFDLRNELARLAAGFEGRDALIEHLCSRLIGLWHESDTELSAREFMGLTEEQYAAYVEQRYGDLIHDFIGQD